MEISQAHNNTNLSGYLSSGEKILRVPRLVRDYVITTMSPDDQYDLVYAAATSYFGSDWRYGTVRMRRRIAFANEIFIHQSSNEMTILRALTVDSKKYFSKSGSSPYSLVISYVSQLKAKGFYGEAYEASREFLGIASSGDPVISDNEQQHLEILAGGCARMIGERQSCIEYILRALPSVRNSGDKGILCSVLVDLALAFEGEGKNSDAADIATEILEITPKESSDYFQAKAILASNNEDKDLAIQNLQQLATKARRLKHHVVADNIAIELASEIDNTEQKLKFLSEVKLRGEREYNYVRATIRRIEILLNDGRQKEITKLDEGDLWRSYSLAYSQRITGIFNWCHKICWRYLAATGQSKRQIELFMISSFVWRLNGNKELEKTYLEKIGTQNPSFYDQSNRNSQLLNYCKSRLHAIDKSA